MALRAWSLQSSPTARCPPANKNLTRRHLGAAAPLHGAAAATARRQPLWIAASATQTVVDETTQVTFPLVHRFWDGDAFRCLGAGSRVKRIVFVDVKIYSVAAYVEADRAAKELAIRERGGFYDVDDDYCQAILDGAFGKVLLVHLVRDVDGPQFSDALNKYLLPRMQLAGELDKLEEFKSFFLGKTLNKDTKVVMFWNVVGDLEVLIAAPTDAYDYSKAKPGLRIRSQAMCRGLFEVFLGSASVVPEARSTWVKGAKSLIESENVIRASRKAGGG